jgi:hypothetical protein
MIGDACKAKSIVIGMRANGGAKEEEAGSTLDSEAGGRIREGNSKSKLQ